MAEIVRVYRQEVPAMRFIGKRYADGGHWGEWFANDWFSTVENAMGGEQAVHRLYEDGDAYIGLRRGKDGAVRILDRRVYRSWDAGARRFPVSGLSSLRPGRMLDIRDGGKCLFPRGRVRRKACRSGAGNPSGRGRCGLVV